MRPSSQPHVLVKYLNAQGRVTEGILLKFVLHVDDGNVHGWLVISPLICRRLSLMEFSGSFSIGSNWSFSHPHSQPNQFRFSTFTKGYSMVLEVFIYCRYSLFSPKKLLPYPLSLPLYPCLIWVSDKTPPALLINARSATFRFIQEMLDLRVIAGRVLWRFHQIKR